MYACVGLYLLFSVIEVGKSPPVVSATTAKWDSPSALLPGIWFKTRNHNVTIQVAHCVINHGNHSGYVYYASRGVIHPSYGGCERNGAVHDVAHLSSVRAQDGGCLHFAGETEQACWRLAPARVLGQYGEDKYEFTKVEILWPDPGTNRSNADVSMSIVVENPRAVPITKDSEDTSYESHLHTATMGQVTTIELFFQRVSLRRFTNSDFGFMAFVSNGLNALTGDPGGEAMEWTQQHDHYDRHGELNVQGDRVRVFTVYLRATCLQSILTEQPRRVWLQLPEAMGGFFTGFVVFGVAIVFAIQRTASALAKCGGFQN